MKKEFAFFRKRYYLDLTTGKATTTEGQPKVKNKIMKSKPTYSEIANSYVLWMEYIDPSGIESEKSFNQKSEAEKIQIITWCFGEEKKED